MHSPTVACTRAATMRRRATTATSSSRNTHSRSEPTPPPPPRRTATAHRVTAARGGRRCGPYTATSQNARWSFRRGSGGKAATAATRAEASTSRAASSSVGSARRCYVISVISVISAISAINVIGVLDNRDSSVGSARCVRIARVERRSRVPQMRVALWSVWLRPKTPHRDPPHSSRRRAAGRAFARMRAHERRRTAHRHNGCSLAARERRVADPARPLPAGDAATCDARHARRRERGDARGRAARLPRPATRARPALLALARRCALRRRSNGRIACCLRSPPLDSCGRLRRRLRRRDLAAACESQQRGCKIARCDAGPTTSQSRRAAANL